MPDMEVLCHGCDTPLDASTESRMAYCASCDDNMLVYAWEIGAPPSYVVSERISPISILV